jgi:hypothetical protein
LRWLAEKICYTAQDVPAAGKRAAAVAYNNDRSVESLLQELEHFLQAPSEMQK